MDVHFHLTDLTVDPHVHTAYESPMRVLFSLVRYCRRRPFRTVVFGFLFLFTALVGRFAVWPPVNALTAKNPETTAFIEYRQAQWRESGREVTVRRTWVPLGRISRHLRKAVVVAEDSAFWDHDGFDLQGIRNAMERNIARRQFAAGGSTITQQLAKNLYFSPEKSVLRKIQEAIVAKRLEVALSKERILELYLNSVEWGDGVFGAEAAARHYFRVSAANLTERQAATLAAMLPSPLRRNPDSPIVRRHAGTILARMRIE
ncbi:MAG: Biosynthetic peptidoglycan transglycosylase [Desulfovibrio sp.]